MLVLACLALLIATMPLRLVMAMTGLGDSGVAARQIVGPVWWGGIDALEANGIAFGTVDAWLAPLPLFKGEVRLHIARNKQLPDDVRGAIFTAFGRHGVRDLDGRLAVSGTFAPLPVSAISATGFSASFASGRCSSASGSLTLFMAAWLPGMNIGNGLSGAAVCDGARLHVPLVSQSGMETVDLRISADGAWEAAIKLATPSAELAAAARATGFQTRNSDYVMTVRGAL